MRPKPLTCATCGAPLTGARLFIDYSWRCPDCEYERLYGPAERRSRTPRQKAVQEERLFPLPPPTPRT